MAGHLDTRTSDSADLARFGYRQELRRSLGAFSCFAAGFSYVSILTTVFQLFAFGYAFGGTRFFWTWPLVFAGQMLVALNFAELAARYPLTGSVYQWARHLSPGFPGWLAGWLMIIGNMVSVAAAAIALQVVLPQIWSGFQILGDDPSLTSRSGAANAVLLGSLLIVVTTVINVVGVRVMAVVNDVGVAAELCGIVLLLILLATHAIRGPAVVFTAQHGPDLPAGPGLAGFLASALMAAYVMYGFDSAGSLAEETVDPRRTAPRAILRAVMVSGVGGALLLLATLMAAPALTDGRLSTEGLPYVITSVFGPDVGRLLLADVAVAITVCTLTIQTGAIRLVYAMARDNQLPASRLLSRVSPRTKTPPLPAVVVGVVAVLMLVLNLGKPEIFTVVTGTAVVVVYLAYLLVTAPLLVHRLRGQADPGAAEMFRPSRFGIAANALAVAYGIAMIVNIAWPRHAVYDVAGTGHWYLRYFAVLFVAVAVAIGAAYRLAGRWRPPTSGRSEARTEPGQPLAAPEPTR